LGRRGSDRRKGESGQLSMLILRSQLYLIHATSLLVHGSGICKTFSQVYKIPLDIDFSNF
jgi:hypothetical protein